MARVIAERDGRTIWRTHSAMRVQNKIRITPQRIRIPSHASTLSQAEEIATRRLAQLLLVDWKLPGWTIAACSNLIDIVFDHRIQITVL